MYREVNEESSLVSSYFENSRGNEELCKVVGVKKLRRSVGATIRKRKVWYASAKW